MILRYRVRQITLSEYSYYFRIVQIYKGIEISDPHHNIVIFNNQIPDITIELMPPDKLNEL